MQKLNTMVRTHDIMIIGDRMSYQSLYRKYRPSTFSDLVGQDAVVKIVKNAIARDQIAHAYLFCGPRGTGKTSMAKLLAQGVNCTNMDQDVCNTCDNCIEQTKGNHPDIVEIDAASNNGVEEIRNLISKVKYTPIMGKYKVYIIDEVHMLSQGAFNALLKTLEEPPSHVIFILATTEIQKVIPTIVSRCQRFDFTRINDTLIAGRLNKVMQLEDLKYEEGISDVIARLSGGGLRNALTILEQSIVYADGPIKITDVYDVTGLVSNEDKIELIKPMIANDIDTTLIKTKDILNRSHNIEQLTTDLIRAVKDSIIFKETQNKDIVSYEHIEFVQYLSENLSLKKSFSFMEILLEASDKMKYSQNQAVYFEISMIKAFREINEGEKIQETLKLDPVRTEDPVSLESSEPVKRKSQTPIEPLVLEPEEDTSFEPINSVPEDQEKEARITSNSKGNEVPNVSHETIKVDKEPVQREKNQTRNINTEKEATMSEERIIELMVTADKDKRIEDQEKISYMNTLKHNIEWAKSVRMFERAELVLSSPDFMVFAFNDDSSARESIVEQNIDESIRLMEELTKEKRIILSTTKQEFSEAIKVFVEKSKTNSLPNKLPSSEFIIKENESVNRDPILESAQDLFGDKLEVKE